MLSMREGGKNGRTLGGSAAPGLTGVSGAYLVVRERVGRREEVGSAAPIRFDVKSKKYASH